MRFQKILLPVGGVVVVALAYRFYNWAGVAMAVGGLVMWLLLHFTRMIQVLKRAANRPMGYVDSAVMFNAKLRVGVSLLHVIAMTRALGVLKSVDEQQPELFRWTDGSDSHVTCEFMDGKLVKWELVRPVEPTPEAVPQSGAPSVGTP
jgi:hypothetical protein